MDQGKVRQTGIKEGEFRRCGLRDAAQGVAPGERRIEDMDGGDFGLTGFLDRRTQPDFAR